MPTKHVPDDVWKRVEKVMMDATIKTKTRFRDSDLLGMILEVGLAHITEDDYWKLAKEKSS